MKKREVSMPELLLGEREKLDGLTLITGVSGSGKDWFLDNAKLPPNLKVVRLDEFGAKQNESWIVDVAKIPDADVAIGWSDNLGEVAKTLRDAYVSGERLTMLWIQPSPDIFRAASAAKAKDATGDVGSWKKTWDAKSKWSDSKVEKYLSAKLELVTAKVNPDELVIVKNSDAKSEIVDGWHGDQKSDRDPSDGSDSRKSR